MNNQDDKKRVTPKLRFPEFQTTLGWKASSVSKTCKSFSGGTPNTANKHFYGGKIPFIRSAEIALEKTELFLTEEGLNNSSAKMVNKGDVLVALYGANSGNVALSKIDGAINQAILCLQHQNNNAFLYHILSCNQEKIVNTYIQGGQGNLSGEIIKSIKLPFPSPKEQQKIADCLSSIDELINLREQKLAALKQHKKGLMQQLFPSHNDLQASKQAIVYPKLRFPQFKDCEGWKVVKLGNVFKRITLKNKENNQNVLTISAQYGLISQLEFFNKSVAAKNITGYYLLHKGDFAYNKSYSNGYPWGAIKPLKLYDKGVVSTLYICFRLQELYLEYGSFFEHYFETGLQNPEISQIAQEGARNHGLLNVSVQDFFENISICLPSSKEQQAIADCLSSLDKLIREENEQIDRLKDHKKGLMQQLFPKIQ